MKSSNYEKFKLFKSNRPIQNGLVKRLKESISKIGYIESRPIIVDKNLFIIDGQNRFTACKELNLPIVYEVYDGRIDSDTLITELNNNQLVWRLNEYIHHYATKDIKFYVILKDFEEKYKLGVSNSISIVGTATGASKLIRQGKNIPLNSKRDIIGEFILSLRELSFFKSAHFVRSIVILFKIATQEDLNKIFKKRMIISHQPSQSSYLVLFQNILNKNRPVDKHIKLS